MDWSCYSCGMLKTCGKCRKTKPETEYNFQDKRRGTRVSWCRSCWRLYMRAYYKQNADTIKARARKWDADHPHEVKARSKRWWADASHRRLDKGRKILKAYGITLDDFEKLLSKQGGVCAICGGTNGKRSLGVDHNHATGRVRGLLCAHCNFAVGLLKDDSIIAKRMVAYLRRFS